MSSVEDPLSEYDLYHYVPSLGAAILFAVLFGFVAITHLIRTFWRPPFPLYWISFVIGGFFQVGGYIARAFSSKDKDAIGPFVSQSLLILLAPALYAASLYMLLGRAAGDDVPFLPRRWLTKVFVGGDVISFLMQSSGGSLMGTSDTADGVKLGEHITIGGLWVQIAFFAGYMVVGGIWWKRLGEGSVRRDELRTLFKSAVAASFFILIRSIFRVIEFMMGNNGYLLTREAFLYVFDSTLMLGVMGIFAWCFPGRYVVSSGNKEQSEVESGMMG